MPHLQNYDLCPQTARFLTTFKRLLDIPSPSGREEQMAAKIKEILSDLGYEHETDAAGNVLVRLEGTDPNAPLCVFAAHMDEIGVVVKHISDDGSLLVDRSGGLIPHKLGERPLLFLGDKGSIIGIPSFGHGHGGGQFPNGIKWEDVRVVTGLTKSQLKELGIRPGSTGVPVKEGRGPVIFGDPAEPLIGAWSFDDRGGLSVQLEVLKLLKEKKIQPRRPTIVAFTVHEEGGCHGAKILTFREKPEIIVAVDGCPIAPSCGAEVSEHPVLWSNDSLIHYDQRLISIFFEAARKAGTDCQTAVFKSVRNDASASYNAGTVSRAAAIAFPRYNSHGYDVAKLGVFANMINTIVELLKMDNW